MNKRLRLGGIVIIVSVAVFCNSCSRDVSTDTSVSDELGSVRERITPSDAVTGGSSGPTVTPYSTLSEWSFETDEKNSVYMEWARQQLQRDFTLKTSGESSLVFLKSFQKDVESVSIQTRPSDGKLRVQITDAIYPD